LNSTSLKNFIGTILVTSTKLIKAEWFFHVPMQTFWKF
jgi:hypothetical protein